MSPQRSTRLQPIQQLASNREDEAMRELAASQKQVSGQQLRLEELQRYINDYANAVPQAATPALMLNRHAFLARLQEAERYQRQLVEQSRLRCEAERAR
jgi:flagellar FliJ protein